MPTLCQQERGNFLFFKKTNPCDLLLLFDLAACRLKKTGHKTDRGAKGTQGLSSWSLSQKLFNL